MDTSRGGAIRQKYHLKILFYDTVEMISNKLTTVKQINKLKFDKMLILCLQKNK